MWKQKFCHRLEFQKMTWDNPRFCLCITGILRGTNRRSIIYPAADSNQHGFSPAKFDRQTLLLYVLGYWFELDACPNISREREQVHTQTKFLNSKRISRGT